MPGFRAIGHHLAGIAALAERQGQRCGGPVLLAGMVLGLGLVQLVCGPLGQTSRFSLELLILVVLQLMGPMLVALLALALLLPRWLEQLERHGDRAWRTSLPATALVGGLLLLLFLVAAVSGGALASPRADLLGEIRDLLAGVLLRDVARAGLRATLFLSALCAWSQWRLQQGLDRGRDPGLMVSDQLSEGLVLLLTLKLLWIGLLDPLPLMFSTNPP